MPLWKKPEPEPEIVTVNPVEDLPISTIRKAEDASEIAYALARVLAWAGHDDSYVGQIRRAAHAVVELTAQHSAHSDRYEEDSDLSAVEHAAEIRRTLDKKTYHRAQLKDDERNLVIRAVEQLADSATDEETTSEANAVLERLRRSNLQFWPRRESED